MLVYFLAARAPFRGRVGAESLKADILATIHTNSVAMPAHAFACGFDVLQLLELHTHHGMIEIDEQIRRCLVAFIRRDAGELRVWHVGTSARRAASVRMPA